MSYWCRHTWNLRCKTYVIDWNCNRFVKINWEFNLRCIESNFTRCNCDCNFFDCNKWVLLDITWVWLRQWLWHSPLVVIDLNKSYSLSQGVNSPLIEGVHLGFSAEGPPALQVARALYFTNINKNFFRKKKRQIESTRIYLMKLIQY